MLAAQWTCLLGRGQVTQAATAEGRQHHVVALARLQKGGDAAQAEICHFDDPIAGGHLGYGARAGVNATDEQVRWLEVPMDHPRTAGMTHATGLVHKFGRNVVFKS